MAPPAATANDTPLTQEQLSELYRNLQKYLDTDVPQLHARIKALEDENVALKEFGGAKKIVDELGGIREQQKLTAKAIRARKNAFYVSGMEDEDISLIKVAAGLIEGGGRKAGFEKVKAGKEFELLHQVQKKYFDAYAHIDPDIHRKAQMAGNDELGGAFIPDQLVADPIGAIYTASAFISLGSKGETRVTVIDGLSGGETSYPKFDGGTASQWIGETQTGTETGVKTGLRTLKPHKCGTYLLITQDMIRSGGFGFEGMVRADLAESVAKLVDRTVPYGKGGDHQPRGILFTDGIKVFRAEDGADFADKAAAVADTVIADWSGGVLDFRRLDKMRLVLRRDEVTIDSSAAFISCPDYFHLLRNAGIAYYSGQTGEKGYLLGSPFITNEQLRAAVGDWGDTSQIPFQNTPGKSIAATTTSTVAKFTDVFYGNWSSVVVGRWGGFEIVSDQGLGTGFRAEVITLRVRQRLDIMVRQPRELIFCPDARALDN